MMYKILTSMFLFQNALSQMGPVGGSLDANGCMIGAGYNWCQATKSCLRQWLEPCPDNYDGCSDCLKRQRNGENIACPCDMIDPVYPRPVDPMPPHPVDPVYPMPMPPSHQHPVDPLPQACPDVMCMMYCENGFILDDQGCNTCSCIRPTAPYLLGPVTVPVTVPVGPSQAGECPIPYSDCSNDYVCPKVTEVTHCSRDGIAGYTTYRLSLVIKNPYVQNIYAIYGDSQYGSHPMSFPPAYQGHSIGNANLGGISDALVAVQSDAAYDSWITIGITHGDTRNELSSVGIDFQSWTEDNGLYTTNGAVFTMNVGEVIVQGEEYVVAQITIPDYQVSDVVLNAQGKLICSDCDSVSTWTENQVTFHLEQPKIAEATIPADCASWFDGCNTCQVRNGNIGGCTMMMCFRQGNPHCLSFDTPSGH